MSGGIAIITYFGFGISIIAGAGITWTIYSSYTNNEESSGRLDDIKGVLDSNTGVLRIHGGTIKSLMTLRLQIELVPASIYGLINRRQCLERRTSTFTMIKLTPNMHTLNS